MLLAMVEEQVASRPIEAQLVQLLREDVSLLLPHLSNPLHDIWFDLGHRAAFQGCLTSDVAQRLADSEQVRGARLGLGGCD
jgi:hypothetical protein